MLSLFVYFSLFVFIFGALYKLFKLQNRIHLRCELYPSALAQSHYEVEETPKERKSIKNSFGMLKAIIGIILINRKKMSLQPRHWLATFLFHLGIFTHAIWLFVVPLFPQLLSLMIFNLLGAFGLFLMLVFALYLLLRKLRAPLRYYVPFEDYFVLSVVFLISFTGIFAFFEVGSVHTVLVMRALLTFSEITVSPFEKLHILAYFSLLLILPFTRITHYIGVFFLHFLLWDARSAEEREPKLSKILKSYKVKWGAEHIAPELSWEEEEKFVEVRKWKG